MKFLLEVGNLITINPLKGFRCFQTACAEVTGNTGIILSYSSEAEILKSQMFNSESAHFSKPEQLNRINWTD